jgi:hypothetical protein
MPIFDFDGSFEKEGFSVEIPENDGKMVAVYSTKVNEKQCVGVTAVP